jgi:UDP-N-acetylmuramate dehydrogenase
MCGNFIVSFLSGFDDILEKSADLAAATTFGIGGPAELMARPRSRDELAGLLAAAASGGLRVRVLGAGSNILAADEGVGGLVIRLVGREFGFMEGLPGALRCGTGVRLARLVREAAARGLSGLECLAGIPGTVGGALVMNAGGRYGCIGDLVEEIEALDTEGESQVLSREEAGFGYRRSDLGGMVLTACRLRMTPENPELVGRRTREVLAEKRASQPLDEASAGCVFRNPSDDMPAGRLIEELGFKGRAVGGAVVSERHANYIVNRGGASCGDVLELIDAIREAAAERRGVELEMEVEIWS